MKIGIASDHRGYALKEALKGSLIDCEILDYGTTNTDPVDYPDYAFKLGEAVAHKEVNMGIAICGSGIGISIACNKVKGIRCAKVDTIEDAIATRNDNDANVIALSGSIDAELAKDLVTTFITTPFSKIDRHQKRIDKITSYEEEHYVG
jgi:ribose 5-phosphate isomerase B